MQVSQRFYCIKMSSSNAQKIEKVVEIGKVSLFLVTDLSKKCDWLNHEVCITKVV